MNMAAPDKQLAGRGLTRNRCGVRPTECPEFTDIKEFSIKECERSKP